MAPRSTAVSVARDEVGGRHRAQRACLPASGRHALVAYAGKMDGTKGIATAIGAELAGAGLQVTLLDAADVESVERFDAVVLGSALYASRWRPDAVAVLKLLAERTSEGASVPTWLFQSGPCGDGALTQQVAPPKKVLRYADKIGTAPPVTFGGRLDPATATGFIARKMATGELAGDFRDFDIIRAWGDRIAHTLTGPRSTASAT